MSDDEARSYVFSGAKWRAGWMLVAGDEETDELVDRLEVQQYMAFSLRHEELRDRAIAPRETGAVTFLQLMVRYAMVWGQIPPGEGHAMDVTLIGRHGGDLVPSCIGIITYCVWIENGIWYHRMKCSILRVFGDGSFSG
jgi:hypothetical protein